MIDTDAPFILLDDARSHQPSPARLYSKPLRTIVAEGIDDMPALLSALCQAQADGLDAAGYISYDAGAAFQPGQADRSSPTGPLAWFGVFGGYREIASQDVRALLPDPDGAWLSPIKPAITRQEYGRAFAKVKEYIQAGDVYQANLTFRAFADLVGDPRALYAALRPQAAAGYGGLIWTGSQWHLSFSPELFFALKDRRVTTKPMKGTAKRETDRDNDIAAKTQLRDDPKQRAENLMIVDLLRNDIAQICVAGSVAVPELFHIESYPTVHQMTSTVTGLLSPGKDVCDLIAAIFPCGSITGAPKIRAMQIIDEVEASSRDLYCGAIGRIDANGDAAFNVAIRTFSTMVTENHLNNQTKRVSLGLGSGVVADSVECDEWQECLTKGAFAQMAGQGTTRFGFDLIETMRFDPAVGILRLELHLERMKTSAAALGFEFDRHAVRNQLHATMFHRESDAKIRLKLAQAGAIAIEIRDAPVMHDQPSRTAILPLPVRPDDFRLRHKTSDRAFYDDSRRSVDGIDEVVFVDPDGYVTEGSFTAVFVERDGILYTPSSSRAALPSVLRRELLDNGQAVETDLQVEDLADGFLLGNSVRGLFSAKRVA